MAATAPATPRSTQRLPWAEVDPSREFIPFQSRMWYVDPSSGRLREAEAEYSRQSRRITKITPNPAWPLSSFISFADMKTMAKLCTKEKISIAQAAIQIIGEQKLTAELKAKLEKAPQVFLDLGEDDGNEPVMPRRMRGAKDTAILTDGAFTL